jgi:hypothetical protein
MKRLFIGDTHGAWGILNEFLKRYKDHRIIQVGDLGLGFPPTINLATGKLFSRDPEFLPKNFRFLRGNHDNPEACRKYPNYLGDYGVDSETKAFYISGAFSIDKHLRIEGQDWWPDEELSYQELQNVIDLYEKVKPDVVISHTCPSHIIMQFMKPPMIPGHRTEKALGQMWEIHKPKLWIFGHWHRHWDKTILGTRFLCLDINQGKVLDI